MIYASSYVHSVYVAIGCPDSVEWNGGMESWNGRVERQNGEYYSLCKLYDHFEWILLVMTQAPLRHCTLSRVQQSWIESTGVWAFETVQNDHCTKMKHSTAQY